MAFPTTVYLSYGMEKRETSEQKHKLGTRAITPDGRVFYYAEASNAAIARGGNLVNGIAAVAAHDMDLAAAAASAGATSFTTSTSLTVTKDQYKDAYVYVNDGPGEGEIYRVKSNTAVSSATGLSITIDEPDGIATAFTTDTKLGLMYSPYKDIHIVDGNGTPTTGVVGVTTAPVTADYFCWVQTSGPAAVLIGAQVAIVGDGIAVSQQDEDGTAERTDYSDESDLVNIGHAMGIPAVATDYQWVMLNIRT
tara:strand:- start:123 stop:875 length:753 start_codon:yes stop_codon:yes gene_type:complete